VITTREAPCLAGALTDGAVPRMCYKWRSGMKPSIPSFAVATVLCAGLLWSTSLDAGSAVIVPLVCDHGGSGQHADLVVTVPAAAEEGSTFTVRVDGQDSGKISHTGLRYIHDMTTRLLLPNGASYVDGSARIIPGTGTPNVREGASVRRQGNALILSLPGRVEDGSSFTPPSFEFQVKVTAAAGSKVLQRFAQYTVTAKAVLIGDVLTTCEPTPKPYTIGVTTVTAPPAQP